MMAKRHAAVCVSDSCDSDTARVHWFQLSSFRCSNCTAAMITCIAILSCVSKKKMGERPEALLMRALIAHQRTSQSATNVNA